MTDLFNREVKINAGTLELKTRSKENEPVLKTDFNIVLSSQRDPNTAVVNIYNLKSDNRKILQTKNLQLIIEAGYSDNISKIFQGEITFVKNILDGNDRITTLQCGDGIQAFKSARINTSFRGPASISDVLKAAADTMGVGIGNVTEKLSQGNVRGALTEFINGIVLSGKSEQQLDKIVKSLGYSWSIQGGQLQLLGPDETMGNNAILLNSSTGMVGTPEMGENGYIKAKSLLQPSLVPGAKIKIESKNDDVNGFFRVEKTTFVCDTWGNDWYADLEAKAL